MEKIQWLGSWGTGKLLGAIKEKKTKVAITGRTLTCSISENKEKSVALYKLRVVKEEKGKHDR